MTFSKKMQFVLTNNFFQKIFKLSRNILRPTWRSFVAHRLRSAALVYSTSVQKTTLAFREKINSSSSPTFEIHQDSGQSPLLQFGSQPPLVNNSNNCVQLLTK